LVDKVQHARHAKGGVAAHRHRRRARMRFLASDGYLSPGQSLAMRHHANIPAFGLEDRTLFDVELEKGAHLARAYGLLAHPADPFQLVAETLALGVDSRMGEIE